MNETIFETAFHEAQLAFSENEVPIGAVIFHTKTFEIIAQAHNQTEQDHNPLAHAELLAIRHACQKLALKRLNGYSLFVTIEPCVMCSGAINWARLDSLYYGASDPKTGAIEQGCCVFTHPQTHHKIEIHKGIHQAECGEIISRFFKEKRLLKSK